MAGEGWVHLASRWALGESRDDEIKEGVVFGFSRHRNGEKEENDKILKVSYTVIDNNNNNDNKH